MLTKEEENLVEKLKKYMRKNKISGEILLFEKEVKSVKESQEISGIPGENHLKTIVMVSKEKNKPITVIIEGNKLISFKKVRRFLKIKEIRLGNYKEVLEKTGYPIGGVPPFGYNAIFLINKEATKKDEVLCGGGSKKSLLKIRVGEILKASKPFVGFFERENK